MKLIGHGVFYNPNTGITGKRDGTETRGWKKVVVKEGRMYEEEAGLVVLIMALWCLHQ